MKKMPGLLLNFCLLVSLLAVGACNKSNTAAPGDGGGSPNRFGPGSGPNSNGDGAMSIKAIMVKLGGRGQQSLTNVIGKELKSETPPWDTLETQSKEYVQFCLALEKTHPTKGSQESWATLTESYTQSANSLEKAVQGKDVEKALAAHHSLEQSCTACHQQHRGGRGGPGGGFGPGGPGGPGRFGGPSQPGQLLPSFMQEMLKMTNEQKKDLADLQKEVDESLAKILNEDQKKELKDMQQNFGRPGGPGPGGPPPGRPFDGPGPDDRPE